jgi:hypothetical protein
MELKEFIKGVLSDILDAVYESQVYAKEKGAIVAPGKMYRGIEENQSEYLTNEADIPPSNIEFSVLLTDKGGDGKGGKIGVSFGSIGVGYKREKETASEHTTQVSFTIPIFYPRQ